MNFRTISALVAKDLTLFFRNRFFAVITVLGIVAYLVIYFVMPGSVSGTLIVGLYAEEKPPAFELEQEGIQFSEVESEEALRDAVAGGQFMAGVALPPDIIDRLASGEKPQITLYFGPDAPEEARQAVESLTRELFYLEAGQPLPVQFSVVALGEDTGLLPPRDRLRPLLAVFLIVTETIFLATLISEEIERRTIQALLVTPLRLREFFAAKGVAGIGLALGQALLFMGIVGGLSSQPAAVIVALLFGAVMVTGLSFLLAVLGKDMMSVMAWGVPVLIIILIPGFTILFPEATTNWARYIPSYYLVDAVHRAANLGQGFGALWSNMLVLAGLGLALFWVGVTAMRRKLQ